MISCPLLILAGGRATRLGTLADQTPKFLMPMGEGKCFADIQLEWAREQGFREVILCVGYLGRQIEDYCKGGESFGLKISYSYDGDVPAGTGGAVKKALPLFSGPVAVTYGDTILALTAEEVFKKSQSSPCDAFMTVFKNTVAGHVCNATITGDRVEYSKTTPQAQYRHIDYGFLILNPAFLSQLPAGAFDLAEALEKTSLKGKLYGMEVNDRFWEMGTPESYQEFKQRFSSRKFP